MVSRHGRWTALVDSEIQRKMCEMLETSALKGYQVEALEAVCLNKRDMLPGRKGAKSARSRKSSSRSRSPSGKTKRRKSGKRSAKSKSAKSRASSAKTDKDVDILSPAAMENLYYIAHGPVDALEMRGFGWADAPKAKKGKKKKKKK